MRRQVSGGAAGRGGPAGAAAAPAAVVVPGGRAGGSRWGSVAASTGPGGFGACFWGVGNRLNVEPPYRRRGAAARAPPALGGLAGSGASGRCRARPRGRAPRSAELSLVPWKRQRDAPALPGGLLGAPIPPGSRRAQLGVEHLAARGASRQSGDAPNLPLSAGSSPGRTPATFRASRQVTLRPGHRSREGILPQGRGTPSIDAHFGIISRNRAPGDHQWRHPSSAVQVTGGSFLFGHLHPGEPNPLDRV